MENLNVGTEIFNHGDRANASHFGTIAQVKTDRWGTQYLIRPEADSDRTQDYWVPNSAFSPAYKGNGLTRFVTKAAYMAYRNEQMKAFAA